MIMIMGKLSRAFIITIGVIFWTTAYGWSQDGDSLSLEAIVKEARDNNPQIKSAYHSWKAVEYRVPQATALADPQVSYKYTGKNGRARTGAMEQEYGISQAIPFPGKRTLAGQAVRDEASSLKANYEKVKREVINEVKSVYYDLFWVSHAVDISQEQKALLKDLEGSALKKYETHQSPQQDALRTSLEYQALNERLYMFEQQHKALQAKFNSLLNRPERQEVPSVKTITRSEFKYSLEDILAKTDQSSPELGMARFEADKAQKQKTLTKMNFLPDFMFSYNYISRTYDAIGPLPDAWEGMVSLNIPFWFNKQRAQIREAKANFESQKEKLQDTKNRTGFEIQDAYFMVKSTGDIISLYDSS